MPAVKNTLFFFIAMALFCIATNLQSQSANTYHHYTTEDGLPSNYVYGAMQDRDGYIWFYTEKGVSKFDGYSFKNFQEQLPNYDVWGLTEDSQGRLWVHAIHDRLVYIYQDGIHEIKTPGNIRFRINSFNETDGLIWFPSSSSFDGSKKSSENFYIRNDTVIHRPRGLPPFYNSNPITLDKIQVFQQTAQHCIYIIEDTIFRYHYNGKLQSKKAVDDPTWIENYGYKLRDYTVSYRISRDEFSLFCSNKNTGILKWDDKKEVGQSIRYDEIYDYPVNPAYVPGYLTENSFQVSLMPAPGFLEVDLDFNLLDTFSVLGISYRRIFKDQQGNFWIATDDDGVYFVSADARNTSNYSFGNDNNLTQLIGNDKGQIFFGTAKGGLYTLGKQQELIPLITSDEIGGNLRGLTLTDDGKIYAGADLGQVEISIANPINNSISTSFLDLILIKDKASPYSDRIYYKKFNEYTKANAYDEKNDILWVSNGQFVGYIDFSNPTLPLESNLFRLNAINQLAIGKNKEVWAAGTGGVWLLEKTEGRGMQSVDDFFKKNVKSLTVDDYNILWVATDHDGIFGFRNDSIYSIPDSKNLIANDLFFDKQGFLWAATDSGIRQYKIDPDNYKEQQLIRIYNTNDGILSNEINAIFVNEDYIYAGTSKGLSKIDKTGKYGDDSPPVLRIQNVRINGKSEKIANKYALNHEQNLLEIDFVALSYKSLGAIEYRYQLEGIDQEWQTTKNTTLRYPSLPPGKYTFRLKAKDIENRGSELLEPIVFQISRPVWERAWFRLLALALIAAVIWLIYKSSINVIKRDEAEKTRIATDMAELELKALQAQMNPHFIFNALTSIRFYIQNNQPDEAGDYLARFAKLMRLFLESSKNNMASIEDEIRLISLYVEMEQLRFEKQFDFKLTVDKAINGYTMKIPTLLLQPFVENSINHGLFHKDEKGLLKIDFKLEKEEVVVCTIEDNGIGREAAGAIPKRSTKGHKSRGMQIVGERLEVLKLKDGLDVQIEIVDLKESDGANRGTRVVLRIPLMD